MTKQPILLNSCARAATAAEARFRLPILERSSWRATRVVALDAAAAEVVRGVAAERWHGARFFSAGPSDEVDLALTGTDGSTSHLSAELDGADLVVLVVTADNGADAASVIGMACNLRGIMTAGFILNEGPDTGRVVSALRPYARVLMVTRDEHDVADVLLALRA
jgi:hypothetical protein